MRAHENEIKVIPFSTVEKIVQKYKKVLNGQWPTLMIFIIQTVVVSLDIIVYYFFIFFLTDEINEYHIKYMCTCFWLSSNITSPNFMILDRNEWEREESKVHRRYNDKCLQSDLWTFLIYIKCKLHKCHMNENHFCSHE